jgi:MSHA biogenesis protein MshP
MKTPLRGRQRGFLIIAAVFLLVVVGGYVAYLASQSNVQQGTTIVDIQSARALQAARAGLEWGAYQVLRNNSCSGSTITFAGTTLSDFSAVVTCTPSGAVTEGATNLVVYTLTSNGCNAASCPSATPSPTYAERQLSLTIAK